MNSLKSKRFYIVIISLVAFMFLTDSIQDKLIDQKFRPWLNVSKIGILLVVVVVDLYFREKRGDKPNYKMMFFYSLVILFVSVVFHSFTKN